MASTAVSAQGTTLKVGTTSTAKNITGATQANPCVITSTAHGLTSGAVVVIASVTGMTQLNGKVAVIEVLTANTFSLLGVDATGYTAYTSGGTATPTQVTVGNLKSYNVSASPKSQLDVTNLSSTSKEFLGGLQDQGSLEINFDRDDTDQGQMALFSSRAGSGIRSSFVITLRNGKTRTFSGEVFSIGESGQVDAPVGSTASIKISGDVVYA